MLHEEHPANVDRGGRSHSEERKPQFLKRNKQQNKSSSSQLSSSSSSSSSAIVLTTNLIINMPWALALTSRKNAHHWNNSHWDDVASAASNDKCPFTSRPCPMPQFCLLASVNDVFPRNVIASASTDVLLSLSTECSKCIGY